MSNEDKPDYRSFTLVLPMEMYEKLEEIKQSNLAKPSVSSIIKRYIQQGLENERSDSESSK